MPASDTQLQQPTQTTTMGPSTPTPPHPPTQPHGPNPHPHLGLDRVQAPQVDGHSLRVGPTIGSAVRLQHGSSSSSAARLGSGAGHAVGIERVDVAAWLCMEGRGGVVAQLSAGQLGGHGGAHVVGSATVSRGLGSCTTQPPTHAPVGRTPGPSRSKSPPASGATQPPSSAPSSPDSSSLVVEGQQTRQQGHRHSVLAPRPGTHVPTRHSSRGHNTTHTRTCCAAAAAGCPQPPAAALPGPWGHQAATTQSAAAAAAGWRMTPRAAACATRTTKTRGYLVLSVLLTEGSAHRTKQPNTAAPAHLSVRGLEC
jgi:hypothetical protein